MFTGKDTGVTVAEGGVSQNPLTRNSSLAETRKALRRHGRRPNSRWWYYYMRSGILAKVHLILGQQGFELLKRLYLRKKPIQ